VWKLSPENIQTLEEVDPSGDLADIARGGQALLSNFSDGRAVNSELVSLYDENTSTFIDSLQQRARFLVEPDFLENRRDRIPIEGFEDIPSCFGAGSILRVELEYDSKLLEIKDSEGITSGSFLEAGEETTFTVVEKDAEWEFDRWETHAAALPPGGIALNCACEGSTKPVCEVQAPEVVPLEHRGVGATPYVMGCTASVKPVGFGASYTECKELLDARTEDAEETRSSEDACREKHSCSSHDLSYFSYTNANSHITFEGDYFACAVNDEESGECPYTEFGDENAISDCLRIFPGESVELEAVAEESEEFLRWSSGIGGICPCVQEPENPHCTITAPEEDRDSNQRVTYSCDAEFEKKVDSSESSDSSDSEHQSSSSNSSASDQSSSSSEEFSSQSSVDEFSSSSSVDDSSSSDYSSVSSEEFSSETFVEDFSSSESYMSSSEYSSSMDVEYMQDDSQSSDYNSSESSDYYFN
jgi:hypothetical protein